MPASDTQSIAWATPLAVRDLLHEPGPTHLVEVTGRIVAGMELASSRAQVRCRLAAAAGSYMRWLRPPAEFELTQAAFGRMWWKRGQESVLDIVVIDDADFAPPTGVLEEEVDQLVAAAVTVRLVAPERPGQTRTLTEDGWVTGWRWVQ